MRLTPRPPSEFNDDNIFVMGSKRTEVASVDVESGSGAVSGPAFIRLTGDTGSLTCGFLAVVPTGFEPVSPR
jgi:hypothetical protein